MIKRKIEIGKYTAKLTFLWCDCLGENQTPLQRNVKVKGWQVSAMVTALASYSEEHGSNLDGGGG